MSKSVLIVDDVAFVRKTLSEMLTAADYHVVGEAQDGVQAIEMFSRLRPDIVTMDIVMPKLSGIDATRQIMKKDKDARIVIITAIGQENFVMEAINVGARDYILKPFKSDEVLRTLERVLLGDQKILSRAGGGKEKSAG
jgi:two-component system chemotaxis response regulator CheY